MKFTVKNTTGGNINDSTRSLGYHYFGVDRDKSEMIFIRPLGGNAYPRFHLYLKKGEEAGDLSFSLHLDQRRPVYKGASAHSGEYEGELVEKEMERIKEFFQKND